MGDVFAGRYELVDPLGEGGVGTVWRAWDRRRETYCAVKVLRQVDAASLLRFIREQSLRLEHPHILAPTGWAGEDDKVLFAMPMVRGGSVATLVGDFGPLPAPLAALLLDQLLDALDAIHSDGVVHRDVKPANLLLDATGTSRPHLWLGDFGIAAGIDEPRLTQGPYALGTPGYLAPEVRQHGWHPDPRADLYSAGRSAWEMLTGVPPEMDVDAEAALAAAPRTDPVPDQLREILAGLAEPSLSARMPSAAEARRRLRESGLIPDDDALVGAGEVEFFDHIPELPEGWTPQGPEAPDTPGGPPSEVITRAAGPSRTAPSRNEPSPAEPTERAPSPGAGAPSPPTGPQKVGPLHAGSPHTDPQHTGPQHTGPQHYGPPRTAPIFAAPPVTAPGSAAAASRPARRTGLTVLSIAMMLIGVLLLILMLWLLA